VSIYLRPSRLLGLRIGRRGRVRWSVGPRWLRPHTGGGDVTGVSTGAGLVTWYEPLRRRRRRR
jgi:hypothetical protein